MGIRSYDDGARTAEAHHTEFASWTFSTTPFVCYGVSTGELGLLIVVGQNALASLGEPNRSLREDHTEP